METNCSGGREFRRVMIGAYLPKCISSLGCPIFSGIVMGGIRTGALIRRIIKE